MSVRHGGFISRFALYVSGCCDHQSNRNNQKPLLVAPGTEVCDPPLHRRPPSDVVGLCRHQEISAARDATVLKVLINTQKG